MTKLRGVLPLSTCLMLLACASEPQTPVQAAQADAECVVRESPTGSNITRRASCKPRDPDQGGLGPQDLRTAPSKAIPRVMSAQ